MFRLKANRRTFFTEIYKSFKKIKSGLPRKILQGGTKLFWGPGDRLRLLSNLRILVKYTQKNI